MSVGNERVSMRFTMASNLGDAGQLAIRESRIARQIGMIPVSVGGVKTNDLGRLGDC